MLIRGEIVKSTFTFIISDPEVVFRFCFKCLDPELCFPMCVHFRSRSYEFEFPLQPNRRNSSNFTAKNILLTFQMEQKGTFYEKK